MLPLYCTNSLGIHDEKCRRTLGESFITLPLYDICQNHAMYKFILTINYLIFLIVIFTGENVAKWGH